MKEKVLFVEDEIDLGNVVRQYLEIMDFEVEWCKNGKAALEKFTAQASRFDMVIVDIGLPEMDGFELAENMIRFLPEVSFLFLTARNEKSDRLHGLKIGADDYITKPFDIDELVLRMRNIIKRKKGGIAAVAVNTVIIGDVSYNKDALELHIDGKESVILTRREAELLEYLISHADKVLKREEILTQLWGENDYFLGRSLDVFISRLRKYLSLSKSVSINNVYGVGFIMNIKRS